MLLDKFKSNPTSEQSTFAEDYRSNIGLSWLAGRVAKGAKGPFSEIATITPQIARHILDNNDDNRRINANAVASLANDIKNGFWKVNGEAIIIASDGSLNDGQHRLNAIIEADMPIQTVVIFGVDRDSRYTVDMGRARTGGDFLGMQGVQNYNVAASVSRLYDLYLKKIYFKSSQHQTKQYLLEFYRKHAKDIDVGASVAGTACTSKDGVSKFAGTAAFGTAYIACRNANMEAAETFFMRLRDGVALPRNSPILALRARLMIAADQRLQTHERSALIMIHWNAWRRGISVSRSLPVPHSWPVLER